MADFEYELTALINKFSLENTSDTPDFILASYMNECLKAFNLAVRRRCEYYGDKSHVNTMFKFKDNKLPNKQIKARKPPDNIVLTSGDPVPEIVLTNDDPVPQDGSHTTLYSNTGQQKAYVVLSEQERAKGFVRPYRDTYTHLPCGTHTTMERSIAETYARDP